MKRLVEFPLEGNGSILVQIDEPETSGAVRAGRGDEGIETARETFENALSRVLPATKSVVERLRSMDSGPDEIHVTFGINLSAQAGAFIASATVEANFKVAVYWVRGSKEPPLVASGG